MRKLFTGILLICLSACTATATSMPASTPIVPSPTALARDTPAFQPTLMATLTATAAPVSIAALPNGCSASGQVVSADLPQPTVGEAYSYRVYLPPCYEADGESRYPVLYLIPGSRSSPDSWVKAGLRPQMDYLILERKIPPMIVVTTQNTDSDVNGETILNELIPAVESEYPIAHDRRYRSVAGASLGGFSAYSLAFQNPDLFCCVALFGAGLSQGDEIRVRRWISQMDDSNRTRVFMNSGTEDAYMLERAQAMKSLLDDIGVENELLVDDSGHHYQYWIPNFGTYLTWLSKDW